MLRAERGVSGGGRTYTVTYLAVDTSGNQTTETCSVGVPYDRSGTVEPLQVRMDKNESGAVVQWSTEEVDADSYNVIRGVLGNITDSVSAYDLGSVACIEAGSADNSTLGNEDAAVPDLGEVFIYLVEYNNDGLTSQFGTESAAKPRLTAGGECQ